MTSPMDGRVPKCDCGAAIARTPHADWCSSRGEATPVPDSLPLAAGLGVIGIDLGTTRSCVAVLGEGGPVVVPNRGGYRATPSTVAIAENGTRLVGHIARRQAVTNAEQTVHAAKRLIGRPWSSPQVQQALAVVPYRIVEGPHADARIELRGKTCSIPELSAYVLQEMRAIAEQHLGRQVDRAVITVPACFNPAQRQATRDAGRIAGLDVIGLINEPTAAALAGGFGSDLERKVAVYHLGGGTFDITILHIRRGVFQVVATAGDTFLGGEDFDQRIIDWLAAGFSRVHPIDPRRDKMALQRLKDAAEKARCELSTADETEINLPFLISTSRNDNRHLTSRLTRAQLEGLTGDLVERTIEICRRTLHEAGIDRREVEDLIVVGGMTRMPRVQRAAADFFGRQPGEGVHPEEAVALGAALHGAALAAGRTPTRLLDFAAGADGVVSVPGRERTGPEREANATFGLTEDEIQRLVEDLKDDAATTRHRAEVEKLRQRATELIEEIQSLWPRVEPILSASEQGQEALRRARAVLAKAQQAIQEGDPAALLAAIEALGRTPARWRRGPGVELSAEARARIDAMLRLIGDEGATRDPGQVLGVPPGADGKTIKRAYFRLAKEFHPDRYFGRELGDHANALQRIFRAIQEAYEVLLQRWSAGASATLPGLGGVPRLAAAADWSRLDLDDAMGFVLSRIDGRTTLHEILLLSPFPQARTVTILLELFSRGVIDLPGPQRPESD